MLLTPEECRAALATISVRLSKMNRLSLKLITIIEAPDFDPGAFDPKDKTGFLDELKELEELKRQVMFRVPELARARGIIDGQAQVSIHFIVLYERFAKIDSNLVEATVAKKAGRDGRVRRELTNASAATREFLPELLEDLPPGTSGVTGFDPGMLEPLQGDLQRQIDRLIEDFRDGKVKGKHDFQERIDRIEETKHRATALAGEVRFSDKHGDLVDFDELFWSLWGMNAQLIRAKAFEKAGDRSKLRERLFVFRGHKHDLEDLLKDVRCP